MGDGMGMMFRVSGEAETLLLNPQAAEQAALPARMDNGETGTTVLQQQTQSRVPYRSRFETPPKKSAYYRRRKNPEAVNDHFKALSYLIVAFRTLIEKPAPSPQEASPPRSALCFPCT